MAKSCSPNFKCKFASIKAQLNFKNAIHLWLEDQMGRELKFQICILLLRSEVLIICLFTARKYSAVHCRFGFQANTQTEFSVYTISQDLKGNLRAVYIICLGRIISLRWRGWTDKSMHSCECPLNWKAKKKNLRVNDFALIRDSVIIIGQQIALTSPVIFVALSCYV